MRCCDQGAHIRERLTANRSDLTLQGGPNQHSTQKPRRTPRTNLSPPRLELQEPAQRYMVSRAQRETTKSKHMHPQLSKSKHMHPQLSATTRPPQELGAGSCTFEAKQYSAYRFRLPPTPGMQLVQFNPRSAQPITERSLINTDGATHSPIRSPNPYLPS